ncbi:MAG: hypothetical protein IJT12_06195 [Paludibacteraceae bacterium]|nr:hypothetical protein [Paludibacteraceae bacterium]
MNNSNPFIVNGAIPAPYFCDRKAETQQLSGHIRNGRNVVLSSARRLGKTGLIQHCFDAPELAEMFSAYSRPFYASSAMMNLEPLERDVYKQFVIEHFAESGKRVDDGVPEQVYDLFAGNTYCMQRTFNVAFEHTPIGGCCTASTIDGTVETILLELDHALRMRLSPLSSKPKALLLAIAAEGTAAHLTSGAFVRKHRLASPSSVQSAVKQLLSEDWITFSGTDKDVSYSLSDKFMQLWIRKNYC